MTPLIAADFFAGAGGLSLGFGRAGFRMAFANELCEEYANTYEQNHQGTTIFRADIRALSAKQVFRTTGLARNEVDVLIGGPPCQGFSINAPTRDIEDERNQLFRHYGRLVLEGLRPKVIVMENVPGMLSLDRGRFVKAIYRLFESAGYRMQHMVLCAAHHGVPQERWRLFFIGTILNKPITFPEPTHYAPVRANFTGGRHLTWLPMISNGVRLPSLFDQFLKPFTTVQDAISDLPPLGINDGNEESKYTRRARTPYQELMREHSTLLTNHVAGALSPQNLQRLQYIPAGGSWRDIPHRFLPKGMQRARRSDHTRRYGRLDPQGLSGTILTKCDPHWGTFFHYDQNRTLTVREAARLQSFPDHYRFTGSRGSQYEQVGNAVPPLLAQTIAEHIKASLFGINEHPASGDHLFIQQTA
ncbi:MAG TPA: DNA cytosine methyltransferase [Bryobacteraceae bacterium]|jgi:DNA (cytosine-5)-methyltransferase 1|nr:DNA cytosine methyltransferase [Bryobacteraceae bacterium]